MHCLVHCHHHEGGEIHMEREGSTRGGGYVGTGKGEGDGKVEGDKNQLFHVVGMTKLLFCIYNRMSLFMAKEIKKGIAMMA